MRTSHLSNSQKLDDLPGPTFGLPGCFFSPSGVDVQNPEMLHSVSSKTPVCYFSVISLRLKPATLFW